ncbi:MAG: nucleotide exchange factor GrpE [Candidatus Kapaibacteriota bacterium]|jgi:molecular chaperone GrpE
MEDKHSKPLRPSSNKIKDLYNTYIKNEEPRTPNIHKEKDIISEKMEKELEDKIEAALNKEGKTVQNDANTINNNFEHNHEKTQNKNMNEENSHIPHELTLDIHEEILQFQSTIAELERERDNYKELLVRKTAEMENLRRRTVKEKEDLLVYGTEKLLSKFIEIPDDFSNALEASKKAQDKDAMITGLEMIYNKINKLFLDAGVTSIPSPVGEPFDVDFHEALMTVSSDLPEGTVTQVLQNGYLLNGKVIRHSKVITSAGN